MLNGKDGVAMLGGVMPIVEENQPGKVGYVKTMKGEDWWGYVKYDDVMKQKDVSFKCVSDKYILHALGNTLFLETQPI